MKPFACFNQRSEHFQLPAPRSTFQLLYDGCYALLLDGKVAVGAELSPCFRKKEPQKMINFRDGGNGGFSPATRNALFDRHARRQAFDQIHVWFFELFDELPRVRRHAVEKTPLAFGEEEIECDGRLARSAQAGDDDHLIARNLERNVFKIVLARAVNGNRAVATIRMK